MSLNLIDMAKGLFANEVASKAASALGESESNVSKAFGGLVPAIFSGLIDKANTPGGADVIANLAGEQANSGLFDNLGSLLGGGDNSSWFSRGSGLVSSLFGNKVDGLVSLISNFAGLKSSSSSSLLSLAVPAILGFLGKYMKTNNLNASGLASLLGSQKNNISAALPAGLGLSSLFSGFGDAAHSAKSAVHTAATRYEETEERGGGMKWLWPVLILAALGALALYMSRGCNKKDSEVTGTTTDSTVVTTDTTTSTTTTTTTTTTTVAGKLDSATNNWIYDLGAEESIDLPGGKKLVVGTNSTEARLVRFLNSSEAVDTVKGNWFEFTNVYFNTGKSTITDASMAQLKNLVEISKAYPTAQFKIGGYTDNTGNASSNVKLSQSRAEAVAAKVKELGAAAGQIVGAEGYGDQHPIASNDTPEGRAQNRRVAVRVKAK